MTELDFTKPIERVTFTDAIEKYTGINIDKIDSEKTKSGADRKVQDS